MRRDFRLYLDDILEAIRQIRTYLADQSEDSFAKDRKTQDAVIRNLEIIGEATGKLPERIQQNEPDIDWRKITGLRNILVHEYFGINLPIVWDVVQNKLGPLETVCQRLLERTAESPDPESQ
jgi:uncharacterized protein with HEPN domain